MAWPKRRPLHPRRSGSPVNRRRSILPGGLPQGTLVDTIGIGGNGVNQDEFIAPQDIRTDRVEFRGATLPYLKEPRNPGRF